MKIAEAVQYLTDVATPFGDMHGKQREAVQMVLKELVVYKDHHARSTKALAEMQVERDLALREVERMKLTLIAWGVRS